ncbi:MAG: transcription antitermination factor NusB [Planctomycetota bacterium]
MSREPDHARLQAWRILTAYDVGRFSRLDQAEPELARLNGRDAALARELIWGSVRHRECYEAVIRPCLHRRGRAPEALLRALVLVAHQLFGMDRIPPHAAVHSMVQVLRSTGQHKLTGVVNAIGRRLAELRREPDPTHPVTGPLSRLQPQAWPSDPAQRHALPAAFMQACLARGPVDDAAWSRVLQVPPLCTRSRDGRAWEHADVLRREGAWHWWRRPQSAIEGAVASGAHLVQDYSQRHLTALAEGIPGLALDCCAAPGGKSTALADLGLRVIACDRSVQKARRLRDLRLPVLVQDGCHPAVAPASAQVVVVDAPCSNSGVWARRPEAKVRYREEALADLCRLQAELLRSAAQLVAPGGSLLYGTCSLDPQENEQQVRALAGWQVHDEHVVWPDAWQAGAYAARLQRRPA